MWRWWRDWRGLQSSQVESTKYPTGVGIQEMKIPKYQNPKNGDFAITVRHFMNLVHFKNWIVDFLFPMECVECGEEGSFICDDCLQKIPLNAMQVCLVCRKDSIHGITHEQCKSKTTLDGLLVASRYNDNPLLDKLIERFKFQYSTSLASPLGFLLLRTLGNSSFSAQGMVVVPVPLHRSRRRWRGFNQAELLAKEIAMWCDLPIIDGLERTKKTRQQSKLSRGDRLKNVKDAFIVEPIHELALRNRIILLIDDVASTTATLEESAKALKKAGATKMIGLVLARG